jgi:chaperonin GroES
MELDRTIPITDATVHSSNLTEYLSPDDLARLGVMVWEGYDKDEASRSGWRERNRAGMDLAMQIVQDKAQPWPGCANVAFPLVTIAALQFHSRAYPAIVNGTDLVKCRVVGDDPDGKAALRAERISRHMSYQLLEEDTPWEEQHDRLLINVPIVGCAFKKTYYNGLEGHNSSELVLADDLVMDYYSKSTERARRKTHVVLRYRNDIYENVKTGVYQDVLQDPWYLAGSTAPTEDEQRRDKTHPSTPDEATPLVFLEQHCYFDFDKDGYAEPVIITIEKTSRTVIRIIHRFDTLDAVVKKGREVIKIRPTEYFTKYGFIPSPDGSVYDMGFGVLLGPLNETVSSGINQLLDAGTMANSGGGFLGRGAKIRGGVYSFNPFEWKRLDSTGDDISKSIYQLPVREPSAVLFQLIGLIIQYTDRISGSTEIMVGENIGQNTPAETGRNMVEQGGKVYAAIFKRIWRSMKEEFKKLYILNSVNMPVQGVAFAAGYKAAREDYLGNPDTVCPAADPNITSDTQRHNRAIMITQRAAQVPGYDPNAVEEMFLRAMHVDGWKTLYKGFDPAAVPKDVKLQIAELKAEVDKAKLDQAKQEFVIDMLEQQRMNAAQIILLEAQAKKFESDAASETGWQQIEMLNATINIARQKDESLTTRIGLALKALEIKQKANEPKPK